MSGLICTLAGIAIGSGIIPVLVAYHYFPRASRKARVWIYAGLFAYLYGAGSVAIFWIADLAPDERLIVIPIVIMTGVLLSLIRRLLRRNGSE